MKHVLLALAAALGLGLAPVVARAQTVTIVDQSETAPLTLTAPHDQGAIGQSFTPTLDTLNFVSLAFEAAYGPGTAQVSILSGAGVSGTVLGTSPVTNLINTGADPVQTTDFLFMTPIALTAGNQYTIRVDNMSLNSFVVESRSDYTRGNLFTGSTSLPGSNLYFIEGLKVAAPEPSPVAALFIGILGLGALALRAHRRSAA